MTQMTAKELFCDTFRREFSRCDLTRLLNWLEQTDFFTAPASRNNHSGCRGGLAFHSLCVYYLMRERYQPSENERGSFAICALLHDLCKAAFYVESTRNVKNEQSGQWEKVPFYKIEDQFPMGHGEKSLWLIERFIKLTADEAIAVRWHMGGFDDAVKGGSFSLSQAYAKYPLALKLHLCDMESSYLIEHYEDLAFDSFNARFGPELGLTLIDGY